MLFKLKEILRYAPLIILTACTKTPSTTVSPREMAKETIPVEESPVLTLGKSKISKNDLITTLENTADLDSSNSEKLLDDLLFRKLVILDARASGQDTTAFFKEQLESHIKLALIDLVEEPAIVEKLANEAYSRYQKELNVSHIFIPISVYASATDTLKAYNSLLEIKKNIQKNHDFEIQAKQWSKDLKSAPLGGNIGWVTVFNLIYPLENVVYSLPVDSVSNPIRSQYGYHLIKVNAVRNNSGRAIVQHIFKYLPDSTSNDSLQKGYSELNQIRTEILNGGKFEDYVAKYSDDYNTKDKLGRLDPIVVGKTEAEFEKAVFSLNKNEISLPVRSSTGLHLIRLIEKLPIQNKAEFLLEHKNKLTTDSRAEFLQNKAKEKFILENNVKINNDVKDNAIRFSSVSLLQRNWKKPTTVILNDVIFNINTKSFTVNEFFNFVVDRQDVEKWPSNSPLEIMNMLFDKFLNQMITKVFEQQTIEKSPDLQRWIKAQEENILFTEYYNDVILSKSLQDTLGQKTFFENNRKLFTLKEIGTLTVKSFASDEDLKAFKQLASEPKPYRLYRGVTPINFTSNSAVLSEDALKKLDGLKDILYSNPGYLVEIGGHSDTREQENISDLRLQEVVKYLVKIGVPLQRIMEVNYKSTIMMDRFDWSKNQAVSFQFFSNLESDLIKTYNSKRPEALTFESFTITRPEFESKMKTSWGDKTGKVEVGGKIEEFTLRTKKTKENYKEYLPEVISKYQEFLKSNLQKKLVQKYKVNYNSDEIINIIKDLKKQN